MCKETLKGHVIISDLIHKVLNGYENHSSDKITDDKGLTGT